MAAITDLTWEQLNTALGGAGKVSVVGGKVTIDVGAVTGDVIDVLTKAGVVEFCSKLLEAAARAQATVNEGAVAGERLNSFAAPVYGGVTGGYVTVTQTFTGRVSVNPATQSVIVGPNT
jgi:hypothetical protein